jgi:hypothetical protein
MGKNKAAVEPKSEAPDVQQTFELNQDEYEFYSEPVTQEGSWNDLTAAEDKNAIVKSSLQALNDPLVRRQLGKQKVNNKA